MKKKWCFFIGLLLTLCFQLITINSSGSNKFNLTNYGSQINARGETISVTLPEIDSVKNNYCEVDGFICKKTETFSNLSYIKTSNTDFLNSIKERFGNVTLFATKQNGETLTFAIGCDNTNRSTAYYDLQSHNEISSSYFERVMGV